MFRKTFSDTDKNITGIFQQIQATIQTYEESIVERILDEIVANSELWEEKLQEALSDPLPKRYWHKRRPRHTIRLFPYMNTGGLRNSLTLKNDYIHIDDNFSVYLDMEISGKGAYFTNQGLRRRKRKGKTGRLPSVAKWKGWVDDVTDGKGRGNIPSLSSVIKNIIKG